MAKHTLFGQFEEQLAKQGVDLNALQRKGLTDILKDNASNPEPIAFVHGNSHGNHSSHGRSRKVDEPSPPSIPTSLKK